MLLLYLNFKSGAMEAKESSVLSNAAVGEVRKRRRTEVLLDLTENNIQEIEVADEEDMEDLENSETESPEDVGEAVLTSTAAAQEFQRPGEAESGTDALKK